MCQRGFPRRGRRWRGLEGSFDDAAMRRLNAAAELDGKDIGRSRCRLAKRAAGAQARGTTSASDSTTRPSALATTVRPTWVGLRSNALGLVFGRAGGELRDRHPVGPAGGPAPADRTGSSLA